MQQGLKTKSQNRIYLLWTAAIAAAMLLFLYVFMGYAPFGGNTVLTGDLNGQYIPFYSHFRSAALGGAGWGYGFDKSLGGGLVGLVAYYITSPLNLLYLLAPVRAFPYVAALIYFVKIVLACVFFNLYLGHKYPGLGWAGVALALCYGFCVYNLVYAQNVMWLDVMALLPLLCLGVDGIVAGGSGLGYTLLLALTLFANFYIGYMACLFLALYFVYSLLTLPQLPNARQWGGAALRFAGGSLLGAGLTAALLLPGLTATGGAKGGLFGFSFSLQTNFSLRLLPEQLVWGGFQWSDVQSGRPQIYCGMLALVLALCFFVSRRIKLREKLAAGGMLLLFVLSFWLKGPNMLWHGLKEPVWFPFRYSFLLCFFMVLLAATAAARGAVGKKELLVSGGILAVGYGLLLVFTQSVSRAKILLTLGLALAMAAALYLLRLVRQKRVKSLLAAGLVVAVAAELAVGGVYIARKFEAYPLAAYQSYIDEAGGTVRAIEAAHPEEAGAYRMEKTFYRTLNDPMLLGYRGVSHFSSVMDGAANDTLDRLGYRGYVLYGHGSTAFADSVLGLRYLFAREGEAAAVPAHWQPSGMDAPLPVYENPNALPLLFAVPGGRAVPPADEDDTFAYQNLLYRALGGEGDILLPAVGTLQNAGHAGLTGTLPPGSSYAVTAQEAGYYYALAKGPSTLETYVNGEYAGLYATAEWGGVINLGWLAAGETATLHWNQSEDVEVEQLLLYYQPAGALEALAETARRRSGDFTVQDGRVSGSIEAAAGELLFTSIPYEENWTALVNGREVTAQSFMGGLLALPLEAGNNEIVLQYRVPGLALGWVVTGLCAAVLLAWLGFILYRKHKRKAEK